MKAFAQLTILVELPNCDSEMEAWEVVDRMARLNAFRIGGALNANNPKLVAFLASGTERVWIVPDDATSETIFGI